MTEFNIVDLISTKRDGQSLTREQIRYFTKRVASGDIPDSQIGAMLMAIFLKGMNTQETVHLTEAMLQSGSTLSWPKEWGSCIGDKHSTGGVGDKISLILAPALAACEVKVPMISGRGLGHTGGTLDKLESIPGFRVSLHPNEMQEVLDKVGCCIVGQNDTLAPADRVLYAIRDITGTVASIPLIASSIISKKAAESLSVLVLDVKCGRAAFATSLDMAENLAWTLVSTAEGLGIKCTALVTQMDHPIGRTIGNSVEVAESIQCLHNEGPEDLEELVCLQGGYILNSLNKVKSKEEGMELIKQTLQNGTAIQKFKEMIIAQGVKEDVADALCQKGANPYTHIPLAPKSHKFEAQKSGIIKDIDAMKFANVCGNLGAGRKKVTDQVYHGVGIELKFRVGDFVKEGEALGVVCHRGDLTANDIELLQQAVVIEESDQEDGLPVQSRLIKVVDRNSHKSSVFIGQ